MQPILIRFGIWNLLASLAVVVALPGQAAHAQGKTPNAPKAQAKSAESGKAEKPRVALPPYFRGVVDEKQRDAIYKIQEEYGGKIAALKAQLESVTKERDAKIAAVLTPEQQKKIEQLQAESKAKRAQKPTKTGTGPAKTSESPPAK